VLYNFQTKALVADSSIVELIGSLEMPDDVRLNKVSGDYAYFTENINSTGTIVHVVDISNPTAPIKVGKIDFSPIKLYSLEIAGNLLYATDGVGLRIMDISDPVNPYQLSYYQEPSQLTCCITYALAISGNHAYIENRAIDHRLSVIDVSDPTTPVKVAELTSGIFFYYFDLKTSGDYLYLDTGVTQTIYIFDISDPLSPNEVGSFYYGGLLNGYCVYDINADYMYLASFVTLAGRVSNDFKIYDISDKQDVKHIGGYNISKGYDDEVTSVSSLSYGHGYVFIAHKEDGVRIVDVSDPSNPQEVDIFNTSGDSRSVIIKNYCVYLSDSQYGLKIYKFTNLGILTQPFGSLDTPVNEAKVSGSVPFTGWALDDLGIESVKLYIKDGKNLVYIDDAVFVTGARPDIEQAYPDYPNNHKAGWGYMMLTNFLPGMVTAVQKGTYEIHAVATDAEGNSVTLGTKTIHVDNANAVKPFGTIETPLPGGTASGNTFINWGWVLTPQPDMIPTDGSTINVWVDGVNVGQPTYNNYRIDIANKFPTYANSNGAVGFFYLDTTAYDNGVHTIQWTATDTGGDTDGIGSRYFTIQNTGADAKASEIRRQKSEDRIELLRIDGDNTQPIFAQKGFSVHRGKNVIYTGDNNEYRINIRELEPLQIQLMENESIISCFLKVGDKFKNPPAGMIIRNNQINWMPGVAYLGNYHLVVVMKNENGDLGKRFFYVSIEPKYGVPER
jgi:hypothetical protein